VDDTKARRRSQAGHPQPRPLTRAGAGFVAIAVVVFAIVWIISMGSFAKTPTNDSTSAPPPPNGVVATLQLDDFAARDDKLSVILRLKATGNLIDTRDALVSEMSISAYGADGIKEFVYEKGRSISSQPLELVAEGHVSDYPSDVYNGNVTIYAEQLFRGPTGEIVKSVDVPVSLGTASSVGGWNTTINAPTAPSTDAAATIHLERTTFTKIFSWFLIAMIAVLPLFTVVISILFLTNRRLVEVDHLGWFVALLLALPFLRSILPGDPPIGARIDVAVFFWCLAAAIVATAIGIVAWYRQSRERLLAEREKLRLGSD